MKQLLPLAALLVLLLPVVQSQIGTGAIPTRICNACEQNQPPPPPPPPPITPPPQWNNWGPWSACSVTCGSGVQTRQRTCNTNCGVCQCQGPATEQQPCVGPYQCPTVCVTCNPPPPPPPGCTVCNQPPPPPPPSCNTCGTVGGIGMGANAYYDPYRNGKRRRRSVPKAQNTTT